MVVVEVVLGILVVVLAVATLYMAINGGLGVVGVVRYVRCPACGHLVLASGTEVPEHCSHCQHLALYHPWHTLHDLAIGHRRPLHSPVGGPGLPQPGETQPPSSLVG